MSDPPSSPVWDGDSLLELNNPTNIRRESISFENFDLEQYRTLLEASLEDHQVVTVVTNSVAAAPLPPMADGDDDAHVRVTDKLAIHCSISSR